MKKIFLFLIVVSSLAWGQEVVEADSEVKEVAKMVVHPNCKRFKADDRAAQTKCLQVSLANDLNDKLGSFFTYMENRGIKKAEASVSFIVNRDGKIVQIEEVEGGNQRLAKLAVRELTKLAKGYPYIQAAELEDGTKVSVAFKLPIIISFERDERIDPQTISEIVLLTLKSETSSYEIRISTRTNKINVYGVSSSKPKFLGTYNKSSEALSEEPYRSLFLQMGNKLLLTEGEILNQKYRLYTLKDDPKADVYLYKLINDKEVFDKKVTAEVFNSTKEYVELILR